MPKRKNHTRQLLTARRSADTAYQQHTGEEKDAPPRLRIMAGHDQGTPVAHQPRHTHDPKPWVEYNGLTGQQLFRYTGRECWTVPVDSQTPIDPTQTVSRSVFARLAAHGIACAPWPDSAGTHARYTFADRSELTWAGTDIYGRECSNYHPTGEHSVMAVRWTQEAKPPYREKIAEFASGNYAADSAALAAWIVTLADCHGRKWQDHATAQDNGAALTWQQRTSRVIAAETPGMHSLRFAVDGECVPGGRTGETWNAVYAVPADIDTAHMTKADAQHFGAPTFERA
ncbi:hypothetical protein [Streptomyces sp. 8N706]|uniref:hypothetical protein n=1 Tax=Streptomyces sp. 8N706 TaxID=3457416 RepID=UPI003FD5C024